MRTMTDRHAGNHLEYQGLSLNQPVVKPHAGVRPGDEQKNRLLEAYVRRELPIEEHDARIGIHRAEPLMGQARAHDV